MQHDFPPIPEPPAMPPTQPLGESARLPASSQQPQSPIQPPHTPPGARPGPAQVPAAGQAATGRQWVTFSQLRNHPLVNISEGREIGRVHDVLLDEPRRVIQAFATKKGLLHGPLYIPASQASIGIDAITFHPGALEGQETSWLDTLPRASDLLGMRVLSHTGQILGNVSDARFAQDSGLLLAYEVIPEQTSVIHRLSRERRLLPVSGIISYGPDAIISRETALAEL